MFHESKNNILQRNWFHSTSLTFKTDYFAKALIKFGAQLKFQVSLKSTFKYVTMKRVKHALKRFV